MTNVYYDLDDFKKTTKKMCKCGHELYRHAFTDNIDYPSNFNLVNEDTLIVYFLRVLQCTACNCKEFH